jgi:enamine deaminase RidA (YjgF/YER057c/UK114 family)
MITHLNPASLPANPAFSQGVSVDGGSRTIYVGGQNAIGVTGIEGDNLAAQTEVALANLRAVLAEGGAELGQVVSLMIHVVGDADLRPALAAFQAVWGGVGPPPAISVARVAGLAHPAFLVEISAVAVVPV